MEPNLYWKQLKAFYKAVDVPFQSAQAPYPVVTVLFPVI